MNDELWKMAEDAGLIFGTGHSWWRVPTTAKLEAFARAVAEDCAKMCDQAADKEIYPYSCYHEKDAEAIRAKYGIKP